MPLILELSARNAAANGVVDLLDAGSGPGKLTILAADHAVLVEITLGKPAFTEAQEGVAIATNLPLSGTGTEAAGAGTPPAKYTASDSDGNVVWSGSVPGNLTIDTPSIAAKQAVVLSSWAHGQPAS